MNKKIKNATPAVLNDLKFKSSIEKTIYKALIEQGINPAYESYTYILSEGFRPTKVFYVRGVTKGFHYEMKPVSNITYTPDFTFTLNGIFVIIEVKGFENDTFYIKKNLFRKYLETWNTPVMFFEIRTKKELLQALNVVRLETKELSNIRSLIPKLPTKEIPIANKLLAERDFSNLQALIYTLTHKIKKDRKKEISKQKYANIDLDSLYILISNLSLIITHEHIS